MKHSLFIFFLLPLILLLFSCRNNDPSVAMAITKRELKAGDSSLHVRNGVLYQTEKPFSGTIKEFYPSQAVKSIIEMEAGRQQGIAKTFFENGTAESIRWYRNGEKDSVHRGWWPNGKLRFEYHFSEGAYQGMFTEWYFSGNMIQQLLYENGREVHGKAWRDNGKLYMNFVMKNGRRYGLNNPNLCYSLKNEKVQ
jgi:antitoxin component YwqK of YwqJK toxin-antitoxin module